MKSVRIGCQAFGSWEAGQLPNFLKNRHGWRPSADCRYQLLERTGLGIQEVEGDFVYVVMSHYLDRLGLRVIDVSDPAAPVEVGALEGFAATDVEIRNGVAYIAALGSGLIVADVRDPSTPILMGSFDTPGTADNVALDQQHAVLADHRGGGVMVFDTSSCVPPLASPRRPGGRHFPGGGPSCDEQN